MLVHCAAGVGRTGVIILTDLMIGCLQSNQVSTPVSGLIIASSAGLFCFQRNTNEVISGREFESETKP